MKNIVLLLLMFAMTSCVADAVVGGSDNDIVGGELVSVSTQIDNSVESRTSLVDSDDDRCIRWSEDDVIGINSELGTANVQGVVDEDGIGQTSSVFWYSREGVVGNITCAYYPYSADAKMSGTMVTTVLPAVQKYVEGSVFATNTAIMVGKPNDAGHLKFVNTCGVLEFKLKGTQLLTSLVLDSESLYLAGTGRVDAAAETPIFALDASLGECSHSVTLDLGEGVQLSESEATSFYFVLPAATYYDLRLTATTADASYNHDMTNHRNLQVRHIAPMTAFVLGQTITSGHIDLASEATSNCYMVSAAKGGKYSFPLKRVDGTAVENVAKVDVLWTTSKSRIISNYYYDAEAAKFCFTTHGGNDNGSAIVAAFDEEMNVLWSWHIWVTDAETQMLGEGGNLAILDRNIGAKWAPKSQADVEAMTGEMAAMTCGFYYQWGRSNPLPGPLNLDAYNVPSKGYYMNNWNYEKTVFKTNTEKVHINADLGKEFKFANGFFTAETPHNKAQSAASPMTMWHGDYVDCYHTWAQDLLSIPVGGSADLWSATTKGLNDPCPAGYRVAAYEEMVDAYSYKNYSHYAGYVNAPFATYTGTNGTAAHSDSFGGYYQGAESNNNLVWLPYAGMRMSYAKNASTLPSTRAENGKVYRTGFCQYDSGYIWSETGSAGIAYMTGVPTESWVVYKTMAGPNSTHYGPDGVYIPTIYMQYCGYPAKYQTSSGSSYCLGISCATPQRCVKIK